MTQMNYLAALAAQLPDATDRRRAQDCYDQHARNGRGFWPVVRGSDGGAQVLRFLVPTPAPAACAPSCRWDVQTGTIDLVPLHTIPAADLPRLVLPA